MTACKRQVYNCIADFLVEAGPAILKENKETRRPELLGLKPLPQYATIEEAIKALKPREIPSAAAVEEELRKLAIEGGYSTDDSEGPTRGGCATALAKDPSDYFGFIG